MGGMCMLCECTKNKHINTTEQQKCTRQQTNTTLVNTCKQAQDLTLDTQPSKGCKRTTTFSLWTNVDTKAASNVYKTSKRKGKLSLFSFCRKFFLTPLI